MKYARYIELAARLEQIGRDRHDPEIVEAARELRELPKEELDDCREAESDGRHSDV